MQDFFKAFVTLFVIVDPIGTALVFLALTKSLSAATAKSVALRASLIAVSVLLFFALAGSWLLQQVGITVPAFRVAGGILLFVTAYRMVMSGESAESHPVTEVRAHDLAVFPLAIPLLAGPGCMTATILISQRMSEQGNFMVAIAAILAVQAVALGCLLLATALIKRLNQSLLNVLERLFGVLLAASAVQFIADGLRLLFT